MSAEIKEGFLCPICMQDLGTVGQLQNHFEEAHSAEDKDVFDQLKGFFDKAKKKILHKNEESLISGSSSSLPSDNTNITSQGGIGYDPFLWDPQELGATRSHSEMFRSVRDVRLDRYVVETNKLLIRLDKLIGSECPAEPGKRKAFEKTVVFWTPDRDVNLCPTCAKSFSILRRKHHCRLCGSIMCDKCSHFLSFDYAKKLTDPAFKFEGTSGFLSRTDSNSSINSILGPEGELHIRTCDYCRKLLERRDQLVQQRNMKPPIVILYDKLKVLIHEADDILPKYVPMVESLSQGKSSYSLSEAMRLRTRMVKLYESIDTLSKRILIYGLDADPPPSKKQANLQKTIRVFASDFMQDNMMGLQALPSVEQYEKLQKVRQEEIQKKIAAEKQAAFEAQEKEREKMKKKDTSPTKSEVKERKERPRSESHDSVGAGWKPSENVVPVNSTDDPMIQQMNIIRGYIKQAKQAHRFDEVNMLEMNLRELKQEYFRNQQAGEL